MAILFGTAIWRHRSQQPITRLLALTGLLFLFGVCSTAVYSSRVLALDPPWFQLTTRINHIAISLFVVLLPVMFWYYPRRISHLPVFPGAVLVALLYSFSEWLQLIEPPFHAFYLLTLLTYPLVLGVALRPAVIPAPQLPPTASIRSIIIGRRSRHNPAYGHPAPQPLRFRRQLCLGM